MTTSSQPGYLVPSSTSGELNDQGLRVFLQSIVTGCTGLPGATVFPRWQPEPPTIPNYGTDWAGVGVVHRSRDTDANVFHDSTGEGSDRIYRNQLLDVLCSFYGPNAEANSELLSMGLEVPQNREALELAGFGLVHTEEAVTVPELVHERWLMRVDVPFQLRRAQVYTYPVLNLLGATGGVQEDTAGTVNPFQTPVSLLTALPAFGMDLNTSTISGWDTGHWS